MIKGIQILLAILLFGVKTTPNETEYLGEIHTEEDLYGLFIEFRVDSEVIAKTSIQKDGTFKLKSSIKQDFDLYYYGIGVNETYVQTVSPSQLDSVILTFNLPKKYKKHFGKVICPKCNKPDQTIPIRYGLKTLEYIQSVNSKGDTILTTKNRLEYYDGGCSTSNIDPQYFCKRDLISF